MLWVLIKAPRRGASNEYSQHMFHGEIRKMSLLLDWKKRLNYSYVNENEPRGSTEFQAIAPISTLSVLIKPSIQRSDVAARS